MQVFPIILLLLFKPLFGQSLESVTEDNLLDQIQISPLARSFQPGEVILVTLLTPRQVVRVFARILKQLIPLEQGLGGVPSNWWGLVGIDLETNPGNYSLKLELHTETNLLARVDHMIEVHKKAFPTRRLTLPERFVTPPNNSLDRIQRESRLISSIFSKTDTRRFWSGSFSRPVPGTASSSFGKRSILNGKTRSPHSGTDFQASKGTPVHSPNGGVVVLSKNLYYSGNTVILDHGQGLYSYLAHLEDSVVKVDDQVQQGTLIGHVGSTGRVTGPHLHWSVRLRKTRVDPLSLIEILSRFDSNLTSR